jgi:hypothetical protein
MPAKSDAKKQASVDDIMASSDMKPILALAKRGNPVSCAICLSKDKDGVILLDKKRKPKKVLADLKKQAGTVGLELEVPSLRFGRVVVDTDVDAQLVTFTINKDASGAMRPKLLERVKKAGFTKVELVVDNGLEQESEEDDAQAAAPAPVADETVPVPPPAPPAQAARPTPASAAPPPAGDEASQDADGLTKELTELVKRMKPVIAADPSRAAALTGLATSGQTALKSGDYAGASIAVGNLRKALDDAGASPAPSAAAAASAAPGPAAPVLNTAAFAKARLAWSATLKKVEGDIGKLQDSFMAAFKGHARASDLQAGFQARVDAMLEQLDEELEDTLDKVTNAADPQERAKLVKQAQQAIQRYEAFIQKDPTLSEIDANPFVPLSVQKTLTATLAVLSKTIG